MSALEGHVLADTHPDVRTPQVPLPMAATDCLAKLGGQRFTTSEDMLTAVTSAARGPAAIFRTKRAVHLSLCAVPTMVMLVIGLLTVYHVRPRLETAHAHVGSVRAGEAADRAGIEAGDVIVAVDGEPIVFASQLRDAVVSASRSADHAFNPPRWSAADDSRDTDAKGHRGSARDHPRKRDVRGEPWSDVAISVAAIDCRLDGRRNPGPAVCACRSRRHRAAPDEYCHCDEEWNPGVRIEDLVAGRFELAARAGSVRCCCSRVTRRS